MRTNSLIILFLGIFSCNFLIPSWGFFAHKLINRQAVFSLPPEMLLFFKKQIDWLEEHATDPDVRRYVSPFEAPRHFIDLDHYGSATPAELPRNFTEAMALFTDVWAVTPGGDTLQIFGNQVFTRDTVFVSPKKFFTFYRWTCPPVAAWKDTTLLRFSSKNYHAFFQRHVLPAFFEEKTQLDADSLSQFLKNEGFAFSSKTVFFKENLSEHGILPWHLAKAQRDLTEAFRQKNARRILRLSADIGHYLADAHVPLHTVSNYNGQKTGQDGIHAFWESRLPELFAEQHYNFWVGKAEYIEHPSEFFWKTVFDSNRLTDSVLHFEKHLRNTFPPDRQICPELRKEKFVLTQCREFAEAYQTALQGMVERRMRAAIKAVASVWYTAWVDAGQPDLSNIEIGAPLESEQKEAEEMRKMLEGGKILGRSEGH